MVVVEVSNSLQSWDCLVEPSLHCMGRKVVCLSKGLDSRKGCCCVSCYMRVIVVAVSHKVTFGTEMVDLVKRVVLAL